MPKILLAAIGHNRLVESLSMAKERPFVVFGTLDRDKIERDGLAKASGLPVYFYECD